MFVDHGSRQHELLLRLVLRILEFGTVQRGVQRAQHNLLAQALECSTSVDGRQLVEADFRLQKRM